MARIIGVHHDHSGDPDLFQNQAARWKASRGLTSAAHAHQELLDRVVDHLYRAARSLQAAADLPHDAAMQQIADTLRRLDDTIREIRGQEYAAHGHDDPADPAPRNGPS